MKTAYFRFYEELNDFLPIEKRKKRFEHPFVDRASVKDMIESFGIPHIEVDLILVNGMSVNFNHKVEDKDDISVYPVFESFNISDVQHLRPKPLREPKFIADVHLGTLAKYMRMIGLDTLYQNNYPYGEIIKISLEEKRTILTKDRDLLKQNDVTHGYWIRSDNPDEQLKEIINRFDLKNEIKEFSRCLECNTILIHVEKEKILDRLPPKVKQRQNEFFYCTNCDKVYWKGSHFDKMKNLIDKVINY
jgi:uncharacterized protein with PIN domain